MNTPFLKNWGAFGTAALVALLLMPGKCYAQASSFQGLGTLGGDISDALAVSADGTVVVGDSKTLPGSNDDEAFIWDAANGMQGLGHLVGRQGPHRYSVALGVSADGSVVVGQSSNYNYDKKAFVWDATNGMQDIGFLPGGFNTEAAYASDVTPDGSVVVGGSESWGNNQFEAFIWDASNGMQGLGDLPGGYSRSKASAISADGSVVVGGSASSQGSEAFIWDATNGMQGLGDLAGGDFRSGASDVTADGSVVVGSGYSSLGSEAFIWDASNGMQGLGDLPGGDFSSQAYAVSADGSVVVGRSITSQGYEAFIWDATNGMRNLREVLEGEHGLDLSGWYLQTAYDLSNDGRVIVGEGYNSQGLREAWRAELGLGNQRPVAVAGDDQSIRAGDQVFLDGSQSYDDNTSSELLIYAWSFSTLPSGSTAILIDADTPTPHFVADLAGSYDVQLIVTDEGGLASEPALISVSSDNLAPTAVATVDLSVTIIRDAVNFDGSASTDPEDDPLTYFWSMTKPAMSIAVLVGDTTAYPSLTPDVEGVYEVTLEVSDFIGPGTSTVIRVTATTASGFAEALIVDASDRVNVLTEGEVTTKGNQNAFGNFLAQAISKIQAGDVAGAINKLNNAIERTDGCPLRDSVDGNGPGRDWITERVAQMNIYDLLTAAAEALEF